MLGSSLVLVNPALIAASHGLREQQGASNRKRYSADIQISRVPLPLLAFLSLGFASVLVCFLVFAHVEWGDCKTLVSFAAHRLK